MLTPLKEAIFFARQHAQPLLIIALLFSLPVWLVDATLVTPETEVEAEADFQDLLIMLFYFAMGVMQFAAAMFYIHAQVQQQPISAGRAIALGLSRFWALFLINFLMALAVSTGLMLLVFPGLYIAYKLLFCEYLLLFHGQRIWQSLRGSFRLNRELSDKLLPPLVLWIVIVAVTSVTQQVLLQGDGSTLLIKLVFESLLLIFSVIGGALLYRLYQCFIAPQLPPPVFPLAVTANNDRELEQPSQPTPSDNFDDPAADDLRADTGIDTETQVDKDKELDPTQDAKENPDQDTDRKQP